jgi:hypothetical protein
VINVACAQSINNAVNIDYDVKASIEGNKLTGESSITVDDFEVNKGDTIWFQLNLNAFKNNSTSFIKGQLEYGSSEYYFLDEENRKYYKSISVKLNGNIHDVLYDKEDTDIAYIIANQKGRLQIDFNYEMIVKKAVSRKFKLIEWFPKLAYFKNQKFEPLHYQGEGLMPLNPYQLNAEITISDTLALLGYEVEYKNNKNIYTIEYKGVRDVVLFFDTIDKYTINKIFIDQNVVDIYSDNVINPIDLKGEDEYLKVFNYLENNYSAFPLSYFLLLKTGKCNCNSSGFGHFIAENKKLLGNEKLSLPLIMALFDQWLSENIQVKDFKDIWIKNGLRHYMQKDYSENEYTERYPRREKAYSFYNNRYEIEKKQIKRDFQLMSADVINSNKYTFYANNNGARIYKWIEQSIGKNALNQFINEVLSQQKEYLTTESFQSLLEEFSGQDFTWLFEDIIKQNTMPNFSISKTNGGEIIITNESEVNSPTLVRVKYIDNSLVDLKIDPFIGEQVVEIDNKSNIAFIYIDPDNLSLNNNQNDRVLSFFGDKPWNYKKVKTNFNIGLNNADGWLLGGGSRNTRLNKHNIDYSLNAFFGTKSKNIIGEGRLQKSYIKDSGLVHAYSVGFYGKSYHFFTPKVRGEKEDPLRYYRLNPYLDLRFRHSIYSNKVSKLSVNYIQLQEESILFSIEGEVDGTRYDKSDIYRLSYESSDYNTLNTNNINANLEYQSYDEDKSYLKFTGSVFNSYKYKKDKKFSFRLWAGYFITNTQRNSSNYADQFSRASLSLSHQGFNDYSYDEYFHTRQDQSSRLIQQTSNTGGGFKTALGNTQRVMMSNDFALAINANVDLPFKLPKYLKFALFADLGYYTSKSFESEDLEGNYVYSTGLTWNVTKGFEIHLPILNSKLINDRYTDLKRSLFERISFSIDINEFNFWQTPLDKIW